MEDERKINFRIRMLIVLASLFVIIPLAAFLIVNLITGSEGRIIVDNFESVYPGLPNRVKEDVFKKLYIVVSENVEDDSLIPESGALIRESSWSAEYNEGQNMNYLSFIVDIAALRQSYSGSIKWSDDANNPYFYGNTGGFSCVPDNERIYADFICEGAYSDTPMIKFPITGKLPLTVEYYSDNYSQYTKYDLKYRVNDDKLTIIVTDYAGGAYEKALNTIRELGFNPEDYEIQYIDKSEENTWVYVGD